MVYTVHCTLYTVYTLYYTINSEAGRELATGSAQQSTIAGHALHTVPIYLS